MLNLHYWIDLSEQFFQGRTISTSCIRKSRLGSLSLNQELNPSIPFHHLSAPSFTAVPWGGSGSSCDNSASTGIQGHSADLMKKCWEAGQAASLPRTVPEGKRHKATPICWFLGSFPLLLGGTPFKVLDYACILKHALFSPLALLCFRFYTWRSMFITALFQWLQLESA